MFRTLTALAAAAAIASVAAAEDTVTTVRTELVYAPELLVSEEGAHEVLESLERQARQACSYTRVVTRTFKVDEACVEDLVDQAVEQIGADTLSRAFAALG